MRLFARRRLTYTAITEVSRALPLQRILATAAAVPPPAAPSAALAAALSTPLTPSFCSSASLSSPSSPSVDVELSVVACEVNSQQLLRQLRRSLDKLLKECFPPRPAPYGSHLTSRSRTNLKKPYTRIAPPFLSNKNSSEISYPNSHPVSSSSVRTSYNPITEFSLPSLRPCPKLQDTTPKLASESTLATRTFFKAPPRPVAESSCSIPRVSCESSFSILKPTTQSSLPSPKLVTETSLRAAKSVTNRPETRPVPGYTSDLFHSFTPFRPKQDAQETSRLVSDECTKESSPRLSDEQKPSPKVESNVSSSRASNPLLGLLSAAVAVAASRLPLSWLRFPSSDNRDSSDRTSLATNAMSTESPSPTTSPSPSSPPSSPPSPHPSCPSSRPPSPPPSPSASSPYSPRPPPWAPSSQPTTPPPSSTTKIPASPSTTTEEEEEEIPASVVPSPESIPVHTSTPSPSLTSSIAPQGINSASPVPSATAAPPSSTVPESPSTEESNPAVPMPPLVPSPTFLVAPIPRVTIVAAPMIVTETAMSRGMTSVLTPTVAGGRQESSASTLHPMATRSDATTLTESWTATPWGSLTHVQPAAELAARAEVLAAAARMAAEGVATSKGPSKTKPVPREDPIPPGMTRVTCCHCGGASPETVVLLAPRELQDSQHAPPLKAQTSSWRRLAKVRSGSGSSSGRMVGGDAVEAPEEKQATRASSSDRLAPHLLHSLPAPLLTRILTKNFAGVEMAALRGACKPLNLAGSCALRSSLWCLRRDLEARAVRLQVAWRRVDRVVAEEEQTLEPLAEGGRNTAAQEEARVLLISLILLEEVRGELDVLAAHASAWPQAGARSRLVGLLAGSVLDEGRRLLRLLPFPYRPSPPSRAHVQSSTTKNRRNKNVSPHCSSPMCSKQPLISENTHPRFPMPSLGAAAAADAVCSFSSRLSEMLATEATVADMAARRIGGSAASALGACALALLEHCACADAMMVVTVGGGDGSAQNNESISGTPSGDSFSQLPFDLHPDTVQVLAVYEVRALDDVPPPWPLPPDHDGARQGNTPESPAAIWLRALGKAVRQQRRRVASARVEAVYERRSAESCRNLGVGLEGEPHRRSQLVALPGGGARHLLERRWPASWISRALPGRSVRVMMELRCGQANAPPVLRTLLSPAIPSATPRNPSSNPPRDPGAFAFFAWRIPPSSQPPECTCSVGKNV